MLWWLREQRRANSEEPTNKNKVEDGSENRGRQIQKNQQTNKKVGCEDGSENRGGQIQKTQQTKIKKHPTKAASILD